MRKNTTYAILLTAALYNGCAIAADADLMSPATKRVGELQQEMSTIPSTPDMEAKARDKFSFASPTTAGFYAQLDIAEQRMQRDKKQRELEEKIEQVQLQKKLVHENADIEKRSRQELQQLEEELRKLVLKLQKNREKEAAVEAQKNDLDAKIAEVEARAASIERELSAKVIDAETRVSAVSEELAKETEARKKAMGLSTGMVQSLSEQLKTSRSEIAALRAQRDALTIDKELGVAKQKALDEKISLYDQRFKEVLGSLESPVRSGAGGGAAPVSVGTVVDDAPPSVEPTGAAEAGVGEPVAPPSVPVTPAKLVPSTPDASSAMGTGSSAGTGASTNPGLAGIPQANFRKTK
jgi:hypothetical protein